MNEIAELKDKELLEYAPLNPVELEFLIRELADRVEKAVPVIKHLWETRYAKEREWIHTRSVAMLTDQYSTVAEKRAYADLAALEVLQDFQAAKTNLHAAQELQKALQAKLYGFLNLNKAVTAAYQAGGR